MEARFVEVPFKDIRHDVREYLATLPAAIDSFREEHIIDARHYRIVVHGETAGIGSIRNGSLITQFIVHEPFGRHGQDLYRQLRRMEQVQTAFVPTYDEGFLAPAIDDAQQIDRQSYFFRESSLEVDSALGDHWSLRLARDADRQFILDHSGDFFAPVDRYLANEQIYLVLRHDVCTGFGVVERSTLCDGVASIGMFTLESQRRAGAGTATIVLMRRLVRSWGLLAVAGCWYYNHASKRTLENAGMIATSRLLKISY